MECTVLTVPLSTLPGAEMIIDPTATIRLFRSHSSASGRACSMKRSKKRSTKRKARVLRYVTLRYVSFRFGTEQNSSASLWLGKHRRCAVSCCPDLGDCKTTGHMQL